MSKKWFRSTASSKKSDKLAIDAVTLDENNSNDSSERRISDLSALSISPLSPEMGLSRNFDSQNMSVIRTNDLMAERSNTLSLSNNTQQNIYQFSHITGLHIGQNVQICNNIEPSSKRRSTTGDTQKTTSINIMMRSKEAVNEKVMDVISTHLGEDWKCLFRNLEFTNGQIEQKIIDYHINGVKEVIYQLLLDYNRNNDNASLGHITSIMWNNGFKECVKILKKHFKNGELVTERSTGNEEQIPKASCVKAKSVD